MPISTDCIVVMCSALALLRVMDTDNTVIRQNVLHQHVDPFHSGAVEATDTDSRRR